MSIDLLQLNSVLSKVKAGTTILLKNGVYNNLDVVIDCNGELKKRIIIKPENAGKVILTGTSTIHIKGSYTTVANLVLRDGGVTGKAVLIEGTHNRITGFDISYSKTDCEQMVRIENNNNRVDHCIFRDWDKKGVWVTVSRPNNNSNFAMIDHNIFKNRQATTATNGLECIRVGTSHFSLSSSKSIIFNNIFDNCNGEIEVISNKSGENIYYKNTMVNCQGTLTLRHGDKCYVYKNKFDQKKKTDSGGVRITGENHAVKYNLFKDINGNKTTRAGISINNGVPKSVINGYFQVKNTEIMNNIFINCSNDFAVGVRVKSNCTLTPITTIISNNTSYQSGNNECFSSHSLVMYGSGVKYSSNKFYASNLGKKPSSGVVQYKPSDFNLSTINEQSYGAIEPSGPQWDDSDSIEKTDLQMSIIDFYPRFLEMVVKDKHVDEIIPKSNQEIVQENVVDNVNQPMIINDKDQLKIIKTKLTEIMELVNKALDE